MLIVTATDDDWSFGNEITHSLSASGLIRLQKKGRHVVVVYRLDLLCLDCVGPGCLLRNLAKDLIEGWSIKINSTPYFHVVPPFGDLDVSSGNSIAPRCICDRATHQNFSPPTLIGRPKCPSTDSSSDVPAVRMPLIWMATSFGGEPVEDFASGHALVIGVGADLPVTARDATAIGAILCDPERGAYPKDRVRVLTEGQSTRNNVVAELEHLIATTGGNDVVTVYYSGHGVVSDDRSYLLTSGSDPHDLQGSALSGRDFTKLLMKIPASRLLLLLDCCHAGAIYTGSREKSRPIVKQTAIPADRFTLLFRGRGTAIIASSKAGEVSLVGGQYSYFTHALIEALCGVGSATQDGLVRVSDLALHARQRVPVLSNGLQHPTLDFEQADNYAVAYYAAGSAELKSIPSEYILPPSMVRQASRADSIGMLRKLLLDAQYRMREVEVIAQDLHLPPGLFVLDDGPTVAWNRILVKLDTKREVERLFTRMDPDFGQNPEWEVAKRAYRSAREGTPSPVGQAGPEDFLEEDPRPVKNSLRPFAQTSEADASNRSDSDTELAQSGIRRLTEGGYGDLGDDADRVLLLAHQALVLVGHINLILTRQGLDTALAKVEAMETFRKISACLNILMLTSNSEAASAEADELVALLTLMKQDVSFAEQIVGSGSASIDHNSLRSLADGIEKNAKRLIDLLRDNA